MRGHGHVSWGEAAATGLVFGFLSMFRTVRILFAIVILVPLSMYLWDSMVTSKLLSDSEYSFSTSEPELDEMEGNRPATISPLFNLTWELTNKSPYLLEQFQLNGELYRCDSFDQPLKSCDYVRRENHVVVATLPAGKHTSTKDQFTFTNTSGKAGIYRAKIWASDVFADTDREY